MITAHKKTDVSNFDHVDARNISSSLMMTLLDLEWLLKARITVFEGNVAVIPELPEKMRGDTTKRRATALGA